MELTVKDKIRNAGYAISVARKLGAEIFLLPHDIVECKPKMMLLFFGSLMQVCVVVVLVLALCSLPPPNIQLQSSRAEAGK